MIVFNEILFIGDVDERNDTLERLDEAIHSDHALTQEIAQAMEEILQKHGFNVVVESMY